MGVATTLVPANFLRVVGLQKSTEESGTGVMRRVLGVRGLVRERFLRGDILRQHVVPVFEGFDDLLQLLTTLEDHGVDRSGVLQVGVPATNRNKNQIRKA